LTIWLLAVVVEVLLVLVVVAVLAGLEQAQH
jgi:hypothetical protein